MMNNIPGGTHHQDRGKPAANKGGGKPRPYPTTMCLHGKLFAYRVGAELAPALVPLLLASFLLCSSVALLLISSPQQALAQGNTFIVVMLGRSQQPGFAPDLLTVHVYDTVVFVNSSATPIAITATDSSFSSPAIAPGKQWKV